MLSSNERAENFLKRFGFDFDKNYYSLSNIK